MRGKILFAAGLGVGYVLGTRAGRERYEQIKTASARLWNDPRVQERVEQAEDFVKDKAPEVAGFVSDGAKKIVGGITGRSATTSSTSGAKKSASTSSRSKSSTAKSSSAKGSTAKGSGSSTSS
jgi:hypothetical protein